MQAELENSSFHTSSPEVNQGTWYGRGMAVKVGKTKDAVFLVVMVRQRTKEFSIQIDNVLIKLCIV